MKQLMMYTRPSFYAMEPSNAAANAPVEACGAHEWPCIAHEWRACAATHAADKTPVLSLLGRHSAQRRFTSSDP